MKNSGKQGYYNGIRNEYEILEAINGKTFNQLSEHLRYVVKEMFPRIEETNIITVEKVPGFAKPDLKFTVEGESHYLSVKFGGSSQVHCEDLSVFVDWLKQNGFSDHIIELYKKYHFGDGTLDGTGSKRMGQEEVLNSMASEIREINDAFNENRYLVRDLCKRVVFEGNDPLKQSADFLYHGDIEEGEICSMDSVLRYFKTKKNDKLITPHFGRIIVRPYARYINGNESYLEKRFKVVFEWCRMMWDLEFIKEWRF